MQISDYPEWSETINEISESGGITLLIGGADSGKSTFATLLTNQSYKESSLAAVIDADLGQSEIGPPACVGLGFISVPVAGMSEIPVAAMEFVGSVSPRGRMLEHVVAVRRLADSAAVRNPRLLIVDTTGFIHGSPAQRLKQAKAEVLRPDHVVSLQRGSECEHILRGISGAENMRIHRMPVAAVITRKTPSYRAQRRAARFAVYFQKSDSRKIPFDQVSFTHTWLNSGAPLPPHELKFISDSAGAPVTHAERAGRFLGIVAAHEPTRSLSVIHEHFKPESVAVTPVSRFRGLLVGLSDSSKLAGLGIVEQMDFRRRVIELRTPVRSISNIRRIHFGILRIGPDGREIGSLRPGDV